MTNKVFTYITALAVPLCMAPGVYANGGQQGSVALSTDEVKVKVNNFNFGDVYNHVFTSANSGYNFTYKAGSDTGNASAGTAVSTGLNSSSTMVAVADFANGPVAYNEAGHTRHHKMHHGFSFAYAADELKVGVNNFNMGHVANMVATMANTGMNMTFRGDSATGNAEAGSMVSTDLNKNQTGVLVTAMGAGPGAVNMGNGGMAMAMEETKVKVNNFNMGCVVNGVATMANTGANMTFGGTSATGNALAAAYVGNEVNSNTTKVAVMDTTSPVAANVSHMGMGDSMGGGDCLPGVCDGGTTAANVGTSGVSMASDETKVEVNNTNMASVDNNVVTTANTGGNVTVDEEDHHHQGPPRGGCSDFGCGDFPMPEPNTTSTGDAAAVSEVTNTVNTNDTTVIVVQ